MADSQRTIDLIFNGVDKTGAAVQSALSNTSKFAGGVESATQPFARATESALKYEAALLTAGAAITAFSIKAAGDFDTGFREIATLIDEPIAALGDFRQAILDYGATSSSSLSEVNSAVYSAISAGVDYTESLEAVRVAEQLSIAGKGDLDNTLTLLVSSLNAYGLEMDQAGRFSDALFTTVKTGQTTLPELNESLQAVTGTAATLGVPFEEVLAALAALTAAGTPTTQAVTQIQAVLAALLKPSAAAATEAERLGLEFSAQAVKADGLQGTLQKVFEATGGNEAVMAKLFPRVEALRAVFPLTGIAAGKFAEALEEINNSAGATQAAYEKLVDSLENTGKRLASSFQSLTVAIGAPLLDEFGSLADAVGAILSSLGRSFTTGELRAITESIEVEFDGLTDLLEGVAEALPAALNMADLSGFTDSLEVVRESVGSVFGDLDLTQAEDLARAIEFVGNAFKALTEFSGGVVDSFGPLLQSIAALVEDATKGGDAAFELGQQFGKLTQVNLVAGALGSLLDALESIALVLIGARAGSGLIGSVKSFTTLLTGSGGLVGALGGLAAAGAAGYGLGNLANEISRITTGETLTDKLGNWLDQISGLDEQSKDLVRSLDLVADAEISRLDDDLRNMNREMERSGDLVYNFSTGLFEIDTSPVLNDLEAEWQEIQAATKAAAVSTQEFADASNEISLDEKLALIESNSQIATARIQADAQVMSSAFDSIGVSVSSTADLLGDLFGQLGNDNISKFDKLGLKEQIEIENERREDNLRLQERLVNAQIRELNLRAEALRNGGGLITIDGAGLQPHLEAFMFEILESIQVRVNAEGYNLLLGVD
jgi:TP901 family phage tail tape measure protein